MHSYYILLSLPTVITYCWLGPYTITSKISDVNYEITSITSRGPAQVVHRNRIKRKQNLA